MAGKTSILFTSDPYVVLSNTLTVILTTSIIVSGHIKHVVWVIWSVRFQGGFRLEKLRLSSSENRNVLVSSLVYELPVLRARLGASQAELAEMIGISRQSYNSYENGKKEMPWTTFMALLAVFQNNPETNRMLESINGIQDFFRATPHN